MNKNDNRPIEKNYFQLAKNWADDYYASAVASRNRWKYLCLFVAIPLCAIMLLSVLVLVPMQHLEPLLIHQYENGLVTIEPVKQVSAPTNRAQIESEIVRYIVNRESYSGASYHEQYALVNLLSSHKVAEQYRRVQDVSNKQSPIVRLRNHGYRKVHIESIIFLDNISRNNDQNHSHHNLAQVDFTITEDEQQNGRETHLPVTALVSWGYRKVSNNPEARWRDWDGFTVTEYQLHQRNV